MKITACFKSVTFIGVVRAENLVALNVLSSETTTSRMTLSASSRFTKNIKGYLVMVSMRGRFIQDVKEARNHSLMVVSINLSLRMKSCLTSPCQESNNPRKITWIQVTNENITKTTLGLEKFTNAVNLHKNFDLNTKFRWNKWQLGFVLPIMNQISTLLQLVG